MLIMQMREELACYDQILAQKQSQIDISQRRCQQLEQFIVEECRKQVPNHEADFSVAGGFITNRLHEPCVLSEDTCSQQSRLVMLGPE